ncbi:Lrp/AsnC family transcriptional regulator [Ralstonia solanacearum]|uniref:Lrp/AsnC family transcriptional regulator n=1 Tax=Ralstonia solanacearum TaxID=305 RepID=A0AAW5ZJT3_RALSL|nr:Lrp/AsnC family transcriptional regulator [Ralstonia solanacearum]MDB0570391.1 Lrp/AsnC family transcriptional regulator [Ralstonia solanacearum]
MQLDTTDLRILQVLQEDGRISNQDLAERVALSPSACLRRVRMLEEGGAITGYRARLGRAALGLELEAIVQVSMRQDVSGWHETFMEAVQRWPEIVAAYIITGDCNYILRVQAPSLQHYSEFIIERLYKAPGVMDIRSNIVLRTLKEREGGLALLMEARGVRPLEGVAGKRGQAD